MCGIAGEITFQGVAPSIAAVAAMNEQMQFRGPDGEGLMHFDNVCLAQRRLKIFDLTTRSKQPMYDPALGLAIVFNGAIYNYQELREELKEKGYSFFSSGDTEVLLKAYHCWGMAMLGKLQGMFAFCIWESEQKRLILCRDRMGIKPLYYHYGNQGLRFSSSLPSLLKHPKVTKQIDPLALHYYLTFHAVPEPITLLKGIHKLAPGTAMVIEEDGSLHSYRYWSFPVEEPNDHLTEGEWIETLEHTLIRAIKRRLIADVPTGILLSGGLDSSLLVALTAHATNRVPHTFSIGFESNENQSGDEFYYSDMVVKAYNTSHHNLFVSNDNLCDMLTACVAAMSEPMTSHDNIGFYLLSKEVSKHVKVVQSGQGADEILAGYHWFQHTVMEHADSPRPAPLGAIVTDRTYEEYLETVTPTYQVHNAADAYLSHLTALTRSNATFDHLQYYESTFALTNGPLARVDNMTMAWGLEARVPFLDHEVVELTSRIPTKFKVRDGGKYILKQLAKKHLPLPIVTRNKGYFPVPALQHIDKKMLAWLKEILSPPAIQKRGLFNQHYVAKLFDAPQHYVTASGASKLWQLGVLELWLTTHNI